MLITDTAKLVIEAKGKRGMTWGEIADAVGNPSRGNVAKLALHAKNIINPSYIKTLEALGFDLVLTTKARKGYAHKKKGEAK